MIENISHKPKIAYVSAPIAFGGIEKVNINFLLNVDRQQFEILPVLFLRPWEKYNYFANELTAHGKKFYTIPVAKAAGETMFRIFRCFFQLLKFIKSQEIDLIHTHGYLADILGCFVSKISGIPIISTCHGFIDGDIKLSIYNKLDCYVLKHFDRIICVSESMKLTIVNRGICKDKIKVIENAPIVKNTDIQCTKHRKELREQNNVSENDILIGYVGRLSDEKGLQYLLKAMAMLIEQSIAFKLIIVGEGPQRSELNNYVLNNKLEHRVIFAGFQENVDEWFKAFDLFVLPSLTEGTPMVLLEAMSHGIPCIASKVGGIPQMIDSGVDGILVAPGDPVEIRNAINALLINPAERGNLSRNAKEKISIKYDFNDWMGKLAKEYMEVIRCQ